MVWNSVAEVGSPVVKLGETWYGLAASASRGEVFHSAEFRLSHWNTLTGEKVYAWSCEFGTVPEGYITHWSAYPTPPPKEGLHDIA